MQVIHDVMYTQVGVWSVSELLVGLILTMGVVYAARRVK